MSNELVPFSIGNLPVCTEEEIGAIEKVKGESRFLQRLQLTQSGSDLVKTRKCHAGTWIIPNGEECTVLGDEVDVVPLAIRSKAVDMTDVGNVVSVYDKDSDEYARIKELPKKAYYGHSFLVLERKSGQLLELYFGSKSGREESDKLVPFLGVGDRQPQTATIKARLIQGREFSWHVPVILKCSEEITDGPDIATILKEKEKFLNPPAAKVEVEEEKSGGRAR